MNVIAEEIGGARILTNSRLAALRTCQRLHYYRYAQGYRPVERAGALRFGSLIHDAWEAWSRAERGDAQLASALGAIAVAAAPDPFDAVRARVLIGGYHARWVDEDLEWLAVEQPFRVALRNPETGRASRLWEVAGKMDGVVRDRTTGYVYVVERKTAGVDIGVGSRYWARLTLDSQVSIYLDAARECGYDARGVLYDVIGKPKLDPFTATPVEERKYTEKASKLKDGTIRPAGSLYANQRESDETPAEFEERLTAHVGEQPDRYFRRGEIVRLADEIEEARFDLWQLAQQLRESERAGRYPRNPGSCERYGRLCEFFGPCSRQGSLEDTTMFRRVAHMHPELEDERGDAEA